MKILSLFDGYSTIQQACKNLGIKVDVCYASEIDPYAIAVTQSNFPETVQLGSVTELVSPVSNGQHIDLMIGGSPCQDLSIAKKNREGLAGKRSGLFWEYVRIRDEVKPKYFILENVASMPKEAKDTISETLGVQPVMINASLVSAQNRKRLFWVGKWNGEKYEQAEIPQPEDEGILLKDIIEDTWDLKYNCSQKCIDGVTKSNYRDRKPIDTNKKLNTLKIGGDVKRIIVNGIWRYLTPIEYLKGQSMPDDYFDKALYKGKPISNTQRYKMCGNAFNCKVIEHIIKNII